MDLQLPGMDGLCATRLIKKSRTLQGVPVVALTSYAMEGDQEKSQEAGCIGYITKPIDTGDFLKTVSHYLSHEDSEESLC
jgi:CheY-like chemotaxis protein